MKTLLDPGIEADAYSDKPWLYAPALDCWFAFRIGEIMTPEQLEDIPVVDEEHPLEEGADGSGIEIRERLGIPAGLKRRKFYLNKSRREEFTFEKGRLYQADFFNPYLDFNKFALRLPGFSIRVIKYINDKTHTMRYVFKNRVTEDAYFAVNMTLLFGEDQERALQEENERSRQASRIGSPSPEVRGELIALPERVASPKQEFFDAETF